MRERHILDSDVLGLLALLAEWQRHVPVAGADLIEVEDLGIPIRRLTEVRTRAGDVIGQRCLEASLLGSAGALGRVDGGDGQRKRFDELAARLLGQLVCDESLPWLIPTPRRRGPSSITTATPSPTGTSKKGTRRPQDEGP
jgi:hypothetical protein